MHSPRYLWSELSVWGAFAKEVWIHIVHTLRPFHQTTATQQSARKGREEKHSKVIPPGKWDYAAKLSGHHQRSVGSQPQKLIEQLNSCTKFNSMYSINVNMDLLYFLISIKTKMTIQEALAASSTDYAGRCKYWGHITAEESTQHILTPCIHK